MRTPAPKTTSSALQPQKGNQPFFRKEEEGAFLSQDLAQLKANAEYQAASPFFGNHSGITPFFTPSAIQTKPATTAGRLTIGQPGDQYEQEADAMADQVVQRLAVDRFPLSVASSAPRVQRACAECAAEDKEQALAPKLQPKAIFESNEEQPLQKKCSACQENSIYPKRIQMEGGPSTASSDLESRLSATKGSGSPLPKDTRGSMESAFGADFSSVRVHTDGGSVQMNQELGAQAFTHGSDIYFNQGKYDAESGSGRHLLAHELTHVVQQGAGDKMISRTPLDVTEISKDIKDGTSTPPELFSWIQALGHQTGEVGFAADFPKGKGPDASPSIVKSLPVDAHFFPAEEFHTDERALIVGGFHGDEEPGFQMVEALVDELKNNKRPFGYTLAFHTLIVPRLNRGAIEDHLNKTGKYDKRCNRQKVDLNRNFPVAGKSHASPDCSNTKKAPVQPEVEALIKIIKAFKPNRILTAHAISAPADAGVFADPNTHKESTELACAMAELVPDPKDRQHNKLGPNRCDPVYPRDKKGQLPKLASLGAFGPGSTQGRTTPVITLEAPEYKGLANTGLTRSKEAFLRPLRGFLVSKAALANMVDQDIVRDIQAFSKVDRILFLTGRLNVRNKIYKRIDARIKSQVAKLNSMGPPKPITIGSQQRAFDVSVGGSSPQAKIVFDKFFLVDGKRNGWDSLPDQYFKKPGRKGGVDKTKWLKESALKRLETILEFSAVPGASRHHWNTEVDFNSTISSDWEKSGTTKGDFFDLGKWLEANAGQAGFEQTYTAGRKGGGHHEEQWHYSYAPIAKPLLKMYRKDVNLTSDVIDEVLKDWQKRARSKRVKLPKDLRSALSSVNISKYIEDINPSLK